jgi:hypothetical protein
MGIDIADMNTTQDYQSFAQIRDYDICFAEFLKPSGNGQKIMQAILLREAFSHFAQQGIAIKQEAPTAILDVSCGPGDYSVAWTSDIARFLPKGMIFYCTDYPGGTWRATSEKYTTVTVKKIEAAAQRRQLLLAQPAVAIDADLFSGEDLLMPSGKSADIVHWSHSGYHVRDALGADRDDPRAIESGLRTAIDKIWAALDERGLMYSVHQTRDISDGVPSQMLPVSRKYCGALDDIPERIATRGGQLGGYVATVNFASPLKFPELDDAGWKALKQTAQWSRLDPSQARTLRLLNFIASDFTDSSKAALEKLGEDGRLAAYVDDFKSIVISNGGHIIVKCAFQMLSKSDEVAIRLEDIARRLRDKKPEYCQEMAIEMGKCLCIAADRQSSVPVAGKMGVGGRLESPLNPGALKHVGIRQ